MASNFYFAVLFFCLVTLQGCAPEPLKSTTSHEGMEAHVMTTLLGGNQSQILFLKPLKGLDSREHFRVSARLLRPQSNLTLHSHFMGYKNRDGVQIRFRRDGDQLYVDVGTPGAIRQTHPLPTGFLSSDFTLRVRIEIHDGVSTGIRLILWNDNQKFVGTTELPIKFLSSANADLDTLRLGWIFNSHGRGVFWGIETQYVTITNADREAPYVD